MSLFAELKQRKVFKVGGAYVQGSTEHAADRPTAASQRHPRGQMHLFVVWAAVQFSVCNCVPHPRVHGSDALLPVMDPIRCDPRFKAVIAKLKTTDPYAAKVCAGKP